MADSMQVSFDPIRGYEIIGAFDWGKGIPQAATSRLVMKAGDLGNALFTMFAQMEWLAAGAINVLDHGSSAPPLLLSSIVLGSSLARVRAFQPGPLRDGYLAATNVARFLPSVLEPPRSSLPLFVPPAPGTGNQGAPLREFQTSAGVPLLLTVGAVGVVAAAAAALAYYGAHKADAEASVAIETLRATAAIDAATRIAMTQVQQGQPIDPSLAAVFQSVGARKEDYRFPTELVLGGVAGVTVVGGGIWAAVSK